VHPSGARLPEPGEIVAGKYRVERVIGQGGMGIVVRATHVLLGEPVAMKLLYPEVAGDADAVARFVREARSAARIKSEHVARVTDVGTTESGAPYLVMEYLEGEDLGSLSTRRGSLPAPEAVELVLQACVGVAEAHAVGIVHRDLKPSNLFLVRGSDGAPSVKVVDFGISKLTRGDAAEAALTSTSAVIGTPLYMSPEQMRAARSVDLRTDVWALGVILYELLAGRTPFLGETLPEVTIKIAVEPPPPLGAVQEGASHALEAVILRCLEKDRERRFPNVAELSLALLEHAPKRARAFAERALAVTQAAGLSASALALPPSPDPRGVGAGVSAGSTLVSPGWTLSSVGRTAPPRSRSLLVAGGTLGIIALAGTTYLGSKVMTPTEAAPVASEEPLRGAPLVPAAPSERTPAVVSEPPPLNASEPAVAAPSASGALPKVSAPLRRRSPARATPAAIAPSPTAPAPRTSATGLFESRKL
jgi:eukaryotic-like serine/threonine-protein kinase